MLIKELIILMMNILENIKDLFNNKLDKKKK